MVVKRDGSRHPFDAEKLKDSVRKAAKEAGHDDVRVASIVDTTSAGALSLAAGVDEISTAELKMKILADLDTMAPEVAAAWRRHDAEVKQVPD